MRRIAAILFLIVALVLASASPAAAQTDYRLNMGGPAITVGATTWAQCSSTGACGGYLAGGSTGTNTRTVTGIPAGMSNPIFQSFRFATTGNITLTFPASVGSSYRVRVFIAENTLSYSPNRVFPLQYNIGGLAFNPQTLCTLNPGDLVLDVVYTCDVTIPALAAGATSLQIIATYSGAGTEPLMNAVEVVQLVSATPTNTPTNTPTATNTPTNTPTIAPSATPIPVPLDAYRLNVGGAAVTVSGVTWAACTDTANCSNYMTGGSTGTSARTTSGIPAFMSQQIFDSYRTAAADTSVTWSFPVVPGGLYRVRVFIAEHDPLVAPARFFPLQYNFAPGYDPNGSCDFESTPLLLDVVLTCEAIRTIPFGFSQLEIIAVHGSGGSPPLVNAIELIRLPDPPTATPTPLPTSTPEPTATPVPPFQPIELSTTPEQRRADELVAVGGGTGLAVIVVFVGVLIHRFFS